jgi:deoxyribose-phosphate aldolase
MASPTPVVSLSSRQVARLMDLTLLKPEATADDVAALCVEANELQVGAVCVSPSMLSVAVASLDPGIAACTVIGFPGGAIDTRVKAFEAALAFSAGATELDMVAAIGSIKAGDWAAVEADIAEVAAAAPSALLKVILETAALTEREIVEACRVARSAGADFVKTSTGFHPSGGASVDAVGWMAEAVGDDLGIKASGGIRDAAAARAMLAAGATRLGVSAGAAILASW